MATTLIKGCIEAILGTGGCGCTWQAGRSFSALAGCTKAAGKDNSCNGDASCIAISASAAACEAYCCHGVDGNGPPRVSSAPSEPLKEVHGPCGAWQWRPGDLAELDGCWVSVEPSLQTLPFNDKATTGPWVGAQGNLGPNNVDWGATFLIVVLVVSALYVAVFGALSQRSGRGFVPHRQFWSELLAMTQDGMHFTSAKLRGQSGGRPASRVAGAIGSASGKSSKSSKKHKKEKKEEQQEKKEKRGGEGRGRERASTAAASEGTGSAEALLPTAAAATTSGAAGTAAGDGGRWVHVPA